MNGRIVALMSSGKKNDTIVLDISVFSRSALCLDAGELLMQKIMCTAPISDPYLTPGLSLGNE